MKIDIPEDILKELVLNQLPYVWNMGSRVVGDSGKNKLENFIISEMLKKIDKMEIPQITPVEVKNRMLDILAQEALENRNKED